MRKLLIAALLFAVPAFAHEAPLGWTYGLECCSNKDCWQEKDAAIEELANGYRVVLTGEVIAYGDKRIKKSKDQYYHRCTLSGDPKAVRSLCLYTPNKGF